MLDLLGDVDHGAADAALTQRGVAKTRTTGFLPTTSAKSSLCIVSGGTRVSILLTSPTSSTVGVWINGRLVADSGHRIWSFVFTIMLGATRVIPSRRRG